MTELHIKGMVCDRCRRTVERDLNQLGLATGTVDLGRVEVVNWPADVSREAVQAALQAEGFDLISDPKALLSS